ncbi:major capsid protein [Rhodococcus qingshengii]|uniref:Major capsid protein n=1 Tax=Rhodococcus qingshengii TaxID=334542 RepID=A0AAW6LNE0_RHOSG|nr:major capsid protein [Rhodococcus qingshengii]MDE8648084.1 major capsid protein [Rhodococcus qingshengii]
MSLIFDGPVHPDDATVFVRNVPTPADHKLSAFLPDKTITDTRVEFASAARVNRTAQFRAFDGNIPMLERDTVETRQVDLLPMSIQGGKGELERLSLERVRQQGGSLAAITDAIYNDLEIGVRSIRNRIEVARGEVLTTGKMQLKGENGLYLTADFQVPTDHFVDAATPWSQVDAANVVQDLSTWVEKYTSDNGFAPGGMIISRKILGFLQRNAEFRTLLSVIQGAPGIVGRSAVDAVLADYGLPPIVEVYDTVINVEGVDTRVIPEEKVVFLPPNPSDLGYVAFGITATAMELMSAAQSDLSFTDAPGLAGVVVKDGPPFRERTMVDSLLLPVIENPKALFVADVL